MEDLDIPWQGQGGGHNSTTHKHLQQSLSLETFDRLCVGLYGEKKNESDANAEHRKGMHALRTLDALRGEGWKKAKSCLVAGTWGTSQRWLG